MSITEARGPAARLALVEEHVRLENRHDLDGIMGTFGASARYDEEPWDDHHIGREAVRAYYDALLCFALLRAMPDLAIDVRQRHVAGDAVLLEVIISGHHLGAWRGLPPTGRPVQFPLCGVFTFDAENRLAGEKIYYDRATVLHCGCWRYSRHREALAPRRLGRWTHSRHEGAKCCVANGNDHGSFGFGTIPQTEVACCTAARLS